jgi:lipoprotein-anchoring transpeptidase ErfK/SrfK
MLFVTMLSQNVSAQFTGPAPKPYTADTAKSSKAKPQKKQAAAVQDDPRYAEALEHLHSLGYWISKSKSPKNYANRQAIYAWQKVEGRKRTGVLKDADYAAVMSSQKPTAHDEINKYHVEVDLDRQVLFTIDSLNRVAWILSISSGSGEYFETLDSTTGEIHGRYALTPRGKFKVYYRLSGWKKSQLGMLYDPLYVVGGVAIHGAPQVPPKPASHGCIRIPMYAADVMYSAVPTGTPVLIHGNNPTKHRNLAASGKEH